MAASSDRPARILRRPEVESRTGLSRASIYGKLNGRPEERDPTFPKPIRLSKHSVGWVEAEIDAWIRERIAQRQVDGYVPLTGFGRKKKLRLPRAVPVIDSAEE